jgi:hypothetical protein
MNAMAGLSLAVAAAALAATDSVVPGAAGALPLSPSQAPTCLPAISACLRGHNRLRTYDPEDPPSLSVAACCSACQRQPGCNGWQLDAATARQECWLLSDFSIKPNANTTQCTSGAMAAPPNPARVNRSGYAGIWVQHGSTADLVNQSFVIGGDTAVAWADVEVGDDVWDWTATDAAFTMQAAAGFYIETALMTGNFAPMWRYKDKEEGGGGIPPVRVNTDGGDIQIFPPYMDQRYQFYFLRAVDRFAAHLGTLPESIRSKVIAAQAEYGSTGDDCPWHGLPEDPEQDVCDQKTRDKQPCPRVGPFDSEWHNFTMSTAPAICASYAKRNISTLWNTDVARLKQLIAMCPASYIKAGMVSHGFQTNYEADNFVGKGTICHTEGYHCRGESWPFCQHGYYLEQPLWATYSHLTWLLRFGVDLPGLSQPNLLNDSYAPLYEMFNRYAGSIRPPADEWVGGIIALRDGLDAANTDRFPEAQFGPFNGTHDHIPRLQKIAAKFAHRGAQLRDPVAAVKGAMPSRKRNGTNDVGIRIWQGNYGNGAITQLAPLESSIGWWGVGPSDQPYGRYARGFQSATSRTEMGFVLDQRLFGGLPLADGRSRRPLTLIVTYLDASEGGVLEVLLDTRSGCTAARRWTGAATGRWVRRTVAVSDGHFGRRCSSKVGGADIVLRSSGGAADMIVHGLEIYDPSKLP